MNIISQTEVGVYRKYNEPEVIHTTTLEKIADQIRTWKDWATKDKDSIGGITPSGIPLNDYRKDENFKDENYTGIIYFDFDKFHSRAEAQFFRNTVSKNPHILIAYISHSGTGVHLGMEFKDLRGHADKHGQAWDSGYAYLDREFPKDVFAYSKIDTSCRNISRIFYVAYDADMHFNVDATPFPWTSSTATTTDFPIPAAYSHDSFEDMPMETQVWVESALEHLDPNNVDYDTWVGVGMALHDAESKGEIIGGLDLWDKWSSWDTQVTVRISKSGKETTFPRYSPDGCEKKWRTFGNHASVKTVGFIWWIAAQHGWAVPAGLTYSNTTYNESPQDNSKVIKQAPMGETYWEMLLTDIPGSIRMTTQHGVIIKLLNHEWGILNEYSTNGKVFSAVHEYIDMALLKRDCSRLERQEYYAVKSVVLGLNKEMDKGNLGELDSTSIDNWAVNPVLSFGDGGYLDVRTGEVVTSGTERLSNCYQLHHGYKIQKRVRALLPSNFHADAYKPEKPLLLEQQPDLEEVLEWCAFRIAQPYREYGMLKSIQTKIGKTTMASLLSKALPGIVAYKPSPDEGWTSLTNSRFTDGLYGALIHSKLVFYDEMGDSKDVRMFPKRVTDPELLLEAKGKDPVQYPRVGFAFVMGNNYMMFKPINGKEDARFDRAGFIRNMDDCEPLSPEVGREIRTTEEIGKLGVYFLWKICQAYSRIADNIEEWSQDKLTRECMEEWYVYVGADDDVVSEIPSDTPLYANADAWAKQHIHLTNIPGYVLSADIVGVISKAGLEINAKSLSMVLKRIFPMLERGMKRVDGIQYRVWYGIAVDGVRRYGEPEIAQESQSGMLEH